MPPPAAGLTIRQTGADTPQAYCPAQPTPSASLLTTVGRLVRSAWPRGRAGASLIGREYAEGGDHDEQPEQDARREPEAAERQ